MQNTSLAPALSPGAATELQGETHFQTAWLGPRSARHQVP